MDEFLRRMGRNFDGPRDDDACGDGFGQPCAAFGCAESAQGRPEHGEEFCVQHLRLVHAFDRWLSCAEDFLSAGEAPVPHGRPAFAVKVGPPSFDYIRGRWAAGVVRGP